MSTMSTPCAGILSNCFDRLYRLRGRRRFHWRKLPSTICARPKIAGRPIGLFQFRRTDEGLHIDEQLPRKMRILIYERKVKGTKFVFQKIGGVLVGDRLTDNHLPPDDYR